MVEIALTIWLASGSVLTERTTPDDCRTVLGIARMLDATGSELHTDEGHVVRIACGGHDIVLALPPSAGDCGVVS